MDNQLTRFEDNDIRKIWHNDEWQFSIIDVISVLTNAVQPSAYWNKTKKVILKENQSLSFWQRLKLASSDGKSYLTDCANTEGVLRIIMSVPSPKAEPFKLWLASVGKQTIDETENPELGIERIIEIYKIKGHSDEWIKNRLQSIETRKALTDEWKQRGVNEGQEYAILTATIAKGTFGLSPSEHSNLKGLERQNLRDHMTPLELIFTALGEEITRSESVDMDAQGFNENHEAAQKGGSLAGKARQLVEKERGKKVVSSDNFLSLNANKNEIKELNEGDNKPE
jgi:DNA-damage-inducible protein D